MAVLAWVVAGAALAQDAKPQMPGFRHVDPALGALPQLGDKPLILLADGDFAPWSFQTEGGQVRGIAVDLALASCKRLAVACTVKALPFADLMDALRRKEGDVVVSGVALSAQLPDDMRPTRAYYRSLGRFVTRSGGTLDGTDIRSLAGRRLGVVKGTTHAAFLQTYYYRSALTPFDNFDGMVEALRTGSVDVVFGDAVPLSFWLRGSLSRGCCLPLGRAFVDEKTFARGQSFILRKDDVALRDAFDDALDQLQGKGETARVFAAYLPPSIW